jgi:Gas vesicle protein
MTTVAAARTTLRPPAPRYDAGQLTLIDLLDRLLEGGIVVQGDITLAVADIDLVDLSLRLVVGTVDSVGRDLRGPTRSPDPQA